MSIENSDIDILFYSFKSLPLSALNEKTITNPQDETINENLSFVYPVFIPRGIKKSNNAILLLHGLNERNWNKYLAWADYLCSSTRKPVILFPIAFHMNRSPQTWSNPRALQSLMEMRKQRFGADRSLSFANVALSERISEQPIRFYSSGKQSINDISQLTNNIKSGKHPLFKENTQINIFSYSIGAFLSQILCMANPEGLFSDSKLFIFCGGGIFSSMFGESRSIMDKTAFKNLFSFYMNDFKNEKGMEFRNDKMLDSFNSMISTDRNQKERETFFRKMGKNLRGISLSNDKVMPYYGVSGALGNKCAKNYFQVMDFPYSYTHENPFPLLNNGLSNEVDSSFLTVFKQAAEFLV